jgi:hypothetical protein
LASQEFIRRFLLHVLPSGFHRIRHYGLLANARRKTHIATARERVLPVRMLDGMFRRADRLGWRVGTGAALREGGLVVPRHPVGGVRGDGRGVAL